MKRSISMFALSAMLLALVTLPTLATEKTMTWMGKISDSACGAKGVNDKACAMKCVKEKGASWVFVDTKSKKVLAIHNQDAVDPDKDYGKELKVTGHVMDDGSLHVESIAPAM